MWFDAKRSCSVKYWQLLHVNMYIAGTSISSELSISWLARVRYTMVWVWYNKHCRISCWFGCVQIYIYYEQSNQKLCDKIDEVSISSCGTVVSVELNMHVEISGWKWYKERRALDIFELWVHLFEHYMLHAIWSIEYYLLRSILYMCEQIQMLHMTSWLFPFVLFFFCWFWSVFSQMDCCHASMSNTMPHTEYEVMIRMEK